MLKHEYNYVLTTRRILSRIQKLVVQLLCMKCPHSHWHWGVGYRCFERSCLHDSSSANYCCFFFFWGKNLVCNSGEFSVHTSAEFGKLCLASFWVILGCPVKIWLSPLQFGHLKDGEIHCLLMPWLHVCLRQLFLEEKENNLDKRYFILQKY